MCLKQNKNLPGKPGWESQLYRYEDLFINRIFIDSWVRILQIIFDVSFDRQKAQGELTLGHVPIKKYSLWPEGKETPPVN